MNPILYKSSSLYTFPSKKPTPLLHDNINKHKLLLVVKQDIALAPELNEMLHKMIKAIKLELKDVEILIFKDKIRLSHYVNLYNANHVLSFGAEAEDLILNMDLSLYTLYRLQNFELLLVNDLVDIYKIQKYKQYLWTLLKQMFA